MGKVIHLREAGKFEEILPRLLEDLRKGNVVEDFFLTIRRKETDAQEDDVTFNCEFYWFGNSCVNIMGLLLWATGKIQNYINRFDDANG